MAKQLVTIIGSDGRKFQSRRTWAEHKRALSECVLGADGVYRFDPHAQSNDTAGSVSGIAVHRARTVRLPPIHLRPTDPTPTSNGDWLPYPSPRSTSRRSLAAKYPVLARMGAGL